MEQVQLLTGCVALARLPRSSPTRRNTPGGMIFHVLNSRRSHPMSLEPLYRACQAKPAYQLRYAWTGCLRDDPACAPDWDAIAPLWEEDGLRLLEHRSVARTVQAALSAQPDVSPVVIATRVKGRLQYAWRRLAPGFPGFTRNVVLRSVGNNTRADVETYIAHQVAKEKKGSSIRIFVSRWKSSLSAVRKSISRNPASRHEENIGIISIWYWSSTSAAASATASDLQPSVTAVSGLQRKGATRSHACP